MTAIIEFLPLSGDAITRRQSQGDKLTNYRLGLSGFMDEHDWQAEHGHVAIHAAAGMLESMSAHARRYGESLLNESREPPKAG